MARSADIGSSGAASFTRNAQRPGRDRPEAVQALWHEFLAALPGVARQRQDANVVWVVMATLHDWRPWLGQAETLLSAPERERVSRKLRLEDRDILVLAYALHRLLLGCWLHLDAMHVPISRDADGRPVVKDSGISTSLSHTRGAVAFAIGSIAPVGVDIEAVARHSPLDDIAAHLCHPTELMSLQALPEELRQAELLRLWVRKEAYLKALGVGLALEMSSFVAAAGSHLPAVAWNRSDGRAVRLSAVALHPDFELACAAPPDTRLIGFRLLPTATNPGA